MNPTACRLWLAALAVTVTMLLNLITRRRKPDFVIGSPDDPYLLRWWIIPRNRWFNIYLHHFLRSDDDRANHDHPWWNCSVLLRGEYWEWKPTSSGDTPWKRKRWIPYCRRATAAHRIQLMTDQYGDEIPVWTLFITGPKVRDWGFLCPQGFRRWQDFVSESNHGERGPGCD